MNFFFLIHSGQSNRVPGTTRAGCAVMPESARRPLVSCVCVCSHGSVLRVADNFSSFASTTSFFFFFLYRGSKPFAAVYEFSERD